MLNSRWLFLTAVVSFSSFGAVSFQEKQLRVDSLMKMQSQVPQIAFEAYQRELGYEAKGFDVDEKAKAETNLLAEKIRTQVFTAYESALREHKSPELAREEVSAAMEADLELAAPELKEDLLKFAQDALDQAQHGGVNAEVNLETVEIALKREVINRNEFLNIEDLHSDTPVAPVVNPSKDSEKKEYKTRKELMESLVSDRDSSRWVSTANQSVKTGQVVKADGKLSLQVKMEFLGATIEAGPTISFSREIATTASIMSEGLNPVIQRDGNFDRFKRDADGNVLVKNGLPVKRYVAFYCDADLRYESNYTGSGGFKYMGLGADVTVSKSYANSANLQSRRIAMPESVANKILNVKMISEICHGDFMKAKINKTMTVRQSLDLMMRNTIAGIVFTNPRTKCVQDSHCKDWFDKEVISLKKAQNTYRCVEDTRDKFRFCQLRGKVGQNCTVVENKKVVSSGQNEFPCDWGLKCVKKSEGTSILNFKMSYATGQCQK